MQDLYQLKKLIEDLIDCEALEFCYIPELSESQFFIPYMMNDALEYYIILKECSIKGIEDYDHVDYTIDAQKRGLLDTFAQTAWVEMVEDKDRVGMILHKSENEAFVIWFKGWNLVSKQYQYHRIGHFWKKGQEQWRILVYMIGTIFDKYTFIGEDAVNEVERELLPLITFAPFRYWSPVSEDLESYYPDSLLGIRTMKEFAKEAGDMRYYRWLMVYERVFYLHHVVGIHILPLAWFDQKVGRLLLKKERGKLWQSIYDRVCLGSLSYPERDYAPSLLKNMNQMREKFSSQLINIGFTGEYPVFFRKKSEHCFEQLIAMEEHPFTCSALDYENFDFRIQGMYSRCPREEAYDNAGFFDGKGYTSAIIRHVNEIDDQEVS